MILKPSKYAIKKPYIKMWLDAKPGFILDEEVGPLALATGAHIVAVTFFIGELYGFTPEVEAKLNRYMRFYNIDELDKT